MFKIPFINYDETYCATIKFNLDKMFVFPFAYQLINQKTNMFLLNKTGKIQRHTGLY